MMIGAAGAGVVGLSIIMTFVFGGLCGGGGGGSWIGFSI
jgi:hypothetical protein